MPWARCTMNCTILELNRPVLFHVFDSENLQLSDLGYDVRAILVAIGNQSKRASTLAL